jgi:hypothetical protein
MKVRLASRSNGQTSVPDSSFEGLLAGFLRQETDGRAGTDPGAASVHGRVGLCQTSLGEGHHPSLLRQLDQRRQDRSHPKTRRGLRLDGNTHIKDIL